MIYAGVHSEYSFIKSSFIDLIQNIREAKARGKTKFLFHGMAEGVMDPIILKIHRVADVLSNEVDSKNLIYMSGAMDTESVYEKFADKLNLKQRISVLSGNSFKWGTRRYSSGFEYIVKYEPTHKEKRFLCFNKLNREHRVMLLEKMWQTGLIEKSFYSFEGDGNMDYLLNNIGDNFPYIKMNSNQLPLRLNITKDRPNPVDIRVDDFYYFQNSAFSVVTETNYFSEKRRYGKQHIAQQLDCLFFTEKVYRCFVLAHPFILMGRPYSIAALQKLGFKSFSPFIDEKYDTVEDDYIRFDLIVKEITRLCNLSDADMLEWQRGVKEIVDYNQHHFFSNDDYRYSLNIEHLFKD